ncbi:schwannomin-interacting protein 1 [Hippocampus comes]|uniref:schwannomin-interacting protein 1 n=1 Tax=Hippocampus comes TaxID=109280 RepID=UPI00094E44B2|nr:PREDICTED: schwannomin-interacting protein 1-like [Hippocampus comes]XP_019726870.1 PREDICTED: schwannomin-interacting protein 1-like [Hippocampus comes]XP_019726871.1 PREDICTED: schwannomin-interacting protein 1-like [Hippocampus comes]
MEVSDKERLRWRDEDTDKDTDHTQEPRDEPGLPIMHWEALSLRIAELEKQEEEKKDKLAKSGAASLEQGRAPVSYADEQGCGRRESWEDGRRRHRRHLDRRDGLDRSDDSDDLSALGSRLQTQMNLQLCFINNSESDDEEQEEEEEEREERDASAAVRGSVVAGHKTATPAAKTEKNKSRGFRSTWRKLRERLRADHKPANPPGAADPPLRGRRLERGDVHKLSLGELRAQRSFLTQTVQKLSSDLVAGLQVRDQLRTEQDAMLLELQDLTSLHG